MTHLSQDLHDYLPEHTPSISYDLKNQYLKHYFSPWSEEDRIASNQEIKQILLDVIAEHSKHPGYALTRKKHDTNWIQNIAENIDFKNFPNVSKPGIALFNVEVRLLPTQAPSFKDIHVEWDGYPFDDIQQSYLTAGTPLSVLHISNDHVWLLILTDGFFGWVKSEAIAFVSTSVMQTYQTTEYAAPLKDHVVSFKSLKELPLSLRIGNLYSVKEVEANNYILYLPTVDSTRNAILKTQKISKNYLALFPEAMTFSNIANVGNQMMGDPYGWGGICGYRDCSSTLRDLMSTFGIWLPRNSKAQIEAGGIAINLKDIHPQEKLQLIHEKALPFLTLLYLPGHILLYLGEKNGVPYVYQSASRCYGTVITPLEFQMKNERAKSLIEEIEQMRYLGR